MDLGDFGSSSSSSSPASSTSSSRPPHHALLPLHDRFRDIPEPIRTQLVDSASHTIRDNVRRYVRRNLDHINQDRGGVGRCRSCIKGLERAVDVAEGTGVEVEEQHRSFLRDLHDEGLWQRWESFKRKRHEVFDMKEEVKKMLENYYKHINSNSLPPPAAELKHQGDEDEEEEEERKKKKKQRSSNAAKMMEGIDIPTSGGGRRRVAWAIVKKPEEEEEPGEEEEEDVDESLEELAKQHPDLYRGYRLFFG